MTTSTDQLGKQGETLAAEYLQQRGYTIVTSNWRCAQGEIDLIATHQTRWIFVEVRTRRSSTTESAFASIVPVKRRRLTVAIYAYLRDHQLDHVQWQVDVIAVAIPRSCQPIIEHVEDALGW